MQPKKHAEAKKKHQLAKSFPRRAAVERHRDRFAESLFNLRQGDGGGHHVRPGEKEIERYCCPFCSPRCPLNHIISTYINQATLYIIFTVHVTCCFLVFKFIYPPPKIEVSVTNQLKFKTAQSLAF
jgi:hypothetical protein